MLGTAAKYDCAAPAEFKPEKALKLTDPATPSTEFTVYAPLKLPVNCAFPAENAELPVGKVMSPLTPQTAFEL